MKEVVRIFNFFGIPLFHVLLVVIAFVQKFYRRVTVRETGGKFRIALLIIACTWLHDTENRVNSSFEFVNTVRMYFALRTFPFFFASPFSAAIVSLRVGLVFIFKNHICFAWKFLRYSLTITAWCSHDVDMHEKSFFSYIGKYFISIRDVPLNVSSIFFQAFVCCNIFSFYFVLTMKILRRKKLTQSIAFFS